VRTHQPPGGASSDIFGTGPVVGAPASGFGRQQQPAAEPQPESAAAGGDFGDDFCKFVDASPSPFHAVQESARRLEEAGFGRISESDIAWDLKPGSRHFFTRNQSTIVAFVVGSKAGTGAKPPRFITLGAHTDSCCLKVNPSVAKTESATGVDQLEVSTYGGGLWHTWFDRDLGIAGRVLVKNDDKPEFESRLVRINEPIARVPNLAIHLTAADQRASFSFNKETHLKPVLESELFRQLNKGDGDDDNEGELSAKDRFLDAVAAAASTTRGQLRDFELCLADTQPSAIGGLSREYIFAPRLDNLMMSYTGVQALIKAAEAGEESEDIFVVTLFDNEEVGSATAQGAGSPIMNEFMERVLSTLVEKGGAVSPHNMSSSVRRSILVSADMAHAAHPNYLSAHQSEHRPKMHGGLVIKTNANQRYATTQTTAWLLREIAQRHEISTQEFVVRNDMGCGSTIGPIIAENTGLRTVDVGIAQLSMHSIREQCGVKDIAPTIRLFERFFYEFGALDDSLQGSD
jgi:aspartyl aminopeptidase